MRALVDPITEYQVGIVMNIIRLLPVYQRMDHVCQMLWRLKGKEYLAKKEKAQW
jgi:hypothetical protein